MMSHQFIAILKEEYMRRVNRTKRAENTSANLSMVSPNWSLANRLGAPHLPRGGPLGGGPPNAGNPTSRTVYCHQCGRHNHKTPDCHYLGALGAIKCENCGRYRHLVKSCWGKGNPKHKRTDKSSDTNTSNKKAKTEQASTSIVKVEENVTFGVEEGGIWFDKSEIGQYSGFKEYDPYDANNDKRVLYYDWLADSATTLQCCIYATGEKRSLTTNP
jgi:hypothetical protein